LDAKAAITELVAYYRNSTRAITMGHTLHQELLTMRLTKDMRMSQHEFLYCYGNTMYDYVEHHGRAEAQMSQNQLLTYLQEAVNLDPDLNQLGLDQMLCMPQGKTLMVLPQYMEALNNIAALADKALPRTGGSGGRDWGGGCQANWTEFGGDSDNDGDSNRSNDTLADDGFTKDEVISYLVHSMAQKKNLRFISSEKWAKLSVECRKYLCDMSPDI
jgi:hypothetical protein